MNPVPTVVTPEIVTFELPLFVSVALSDLLAPTFTFPKPKLVGLALTSEVGATAVPVRETITGEFGALLARETEPVAAPAAVGANTTLKMEFPPAPIVNGVVNPVMLKPAPETLA